MGRNPILQINSDHVGMFINIYNIHYIYIINYIYMFANWTCFLMLMRLEISSDFRDP